MAKNLYIVVPAEEIESVLLNGVKCNETGEIWLYEDKRVSGTINGKVVSFPMSQISAAAKNLNNVAVLKVSSEGLSLPIRLSTIRPNTMNLESFNYVWLSCQETIKPEYLEFVKFEKLI